ncbi:MAG TPA: basic secretory protein-like protein [Verrucomicrobiae bacterium]
MISLRYLLTGIGLLAGSLSLSAEPKVVFEHDASGAGFTFKRVPLPANNDAATEAKFVIVDGERDRNGGELAVLHDGKVPTGEDQPGANFFFRAGIDGGRISVDLGRSVSVKQINSYSWHAGTRGPQVYKVYGASGEGQGFEAAPRKGVSPESCGWKLIASVDTRPKDGDGGGQYAVAISDSKGEVLGDHRHLLFEISRTEDRDAFGNTFFSEIDVIDAKGPAPTSSVVPVGPKIVKEFTAAEGKYQFLLDVTAAPDLAEWAEKELKPVVIEWYPKLVTMLPSEGFTAPAKVTLKFRNDIGGLPASAGGGQINLNSTWFRKELKREALGSVVHEMVHIIQSYGRVRGGNRVPGWIVEGIPDYIRWFLYEPQTKGAEVTARNIDSVKYDASYRITGNFLNWVTANYGKDVVLKLNAAARRGEYTEQTWQTLTGKSVQELGEEWKKANAARLEKAGKTEAQ